MSFFCLVQQGRRNGEKVVRPMYMGVRLHPTKDMEEHCKLPSRDLGRSPRSKRFSTCEFVQKYVMHAQCSVMHAQCRITCMHSAVSCMHSAGLRACTVQCHVCTVQDYMTDLCERTKRMPNSVKTSDLCSKLFRCI